MDVFMDPQGSKAGQKMNEEWVNDSSINYHFWSSIYNFLNST